MQNLTQKFSEFLCSTSFESIPHEAVIAAKHIIADCIGAIVGGMAEKEMRQLHRNLATKNQGEASLLGLKNKTDPQIAAFLNGTAGTFLEMDEGHQFAKGHPAMHIFPALFSAAQGRNISGRQFLHALFWATILPPESALPASLTLRCIHTAHGADWERHRR